MGTAIEERQLLSGINRLRNENATLRTEVDGLRTRLQSVTQKLARGLTAAQAQDVMAENAHLRAVNDALVKRNTILAEKLRCT